MKLPAVCIQLFSKWRWSFCNLLETIAQNLLFISSCRELHHRHCQFHWRFNKLKKSSIVHFLPSTRYIHHLISSHGNLMTFSFYINLFYCRMIGTFSLPSTRKRSQWTMACKNDYIIPLRWCNFHHITPLSFLSLFSLFLLAITSDYILMS